MRTPLGTLCLAIVGTVILAKVGLAQQGSTTDGSPAGTISSELRGAGAAAELAYNSGLRTLKRAQAYDGQALKASTPEKAAKSHERAQGAYRESISAFVDAVTAQPSMYKSWYYIGLADRQLGNYDEALSAYAKVLELNPHHPDAMENRGEVFLKLNQIEEAQSTYMDLLRESRPLANELISAMRRWIETRRQDTQGISPAEIEGLSKWVDERAAIAAETVSLRPEQQRR
jgi:tetratricopeptide (TPR) repeat protein